MARRIVTIIVCLVAGVVVTITVAWVCAITINLPAGRGRNVSEFEHRGEYFQARWTRWGGQLTACSEEVGSADLNRQVTTHDARGWPFLCLASSSEYRDIPVGTNGNARVTFQVIDGFRVADRDWGFFMGADLPVVVPWRPLWPAFLANVLFWTGLIWLIIKAPPSITRRLRWREGLCPWCRYPVGISQVCTECGKPHPKFSRRLVEW